MVDDVYLFRIITQFFGRTKSVLIAWRMAGAFQCSVLSER